ncbi:MAG: MFS transporter [Coriobacteriia bacterium]|nr:MFS transporter [Coriobacteriia bacterium]
MDNSGKNNKENKKKLHYKWIALSNTTLGVLMSSINANIILISMPAIFRGMNMNPLSPEGSMYMLWMMMGFTVVTAAFLVSFGRVSDIYGRVKLYNAGFAIFTLASILLFFAPGTGPTGMTFLIIFRLLQGVGSGFLFANSIAIITDAFPSNQRGTALGLNQITSIGGTLLGIILGGVLSAIDWRLVFLVSVPVGLFGTVWAYLKLKEQAKPDKTQKIDWLGNATFAIGLTVLLLGLTLGIMPYGSANMGWGNPLVIGSISLGALLLIAFAITEFRVKMPMFHMNLFKIRAFAFGNISAFLSSIARGGLQFMLIIWLQGIWLPLHGFSYESTPLWAGIYMLPMMGGFFITGPIFGRISDLFGSRIPATVGMVLSTIGFILLTFLPANFGYGAFFVVLLVLGIGMGMFAAPNTSAIMNSVPAEHRGACSGMRATIQNTGMALSMALYFAILIAGLSSQLPGVLQSGMQAAGVPAATVQQVASMPPTEALFSTFLGFDPMQTLIGADALSNLPAATQTALLDPEFFPQTIASAVMNSLHISFFISAGLSALAAVSSFFSSRSRGKSRSRGQGRVRRTAEAQQPLPESQG